jgi:hypothetical protein
MIGHRFSRMNTDKEQAGIMGGMSNENPLRQDAAAYTVQALPEEHLKEQQERYAQLLERLGPPSVRRN